MPAREGWPERGEAGASMRKGGSPVSRQLIYLAGRTGKSGFNVKVINPYVKLKKKGAMLPRVLMAHV